MSRHILYAGGLDLITQYDKIETKPFAQETQTAISVLMYTLIVILIIKWSSYQDMY